MPRPASSTRGLSAEPIQSPAGIRLKSVQNTLRTNLSLDNHVHMSRPNMRCKQPPALVQANLPNYIQNNNPTRSIERKGRFHHPCKFLINASRVSIQASATRLIVLPVHRAGLITMQVHAITGKRNKVPHSTNTQTREYTDYLNTD